MSNDFYNREGHENEDDDDDENIIDNNKCMYNCPN